jgi:hypothetical protein
MNQEPKIPQKRGRKPMDPELKRQTITMTLSPDIVRRIEAIAESTDRSKSTVINDALRAMMSLT